VLDLTQSLGALPFDIQVVRPDFMVAAGYKWLLGPYSLGLLYVAPKWQAAAPLEHNWMNRRDSQDFAGLVNYKDGFQPGARKFDMGEKSNPAQLMAASAALSQILNISKTLALRNAGIAARARDMGMGMIADTFRAPHYIALGFKPGVPDGLAETLSDKNIYVSVRGSCVRVTPHLYNNQQDIDRLFDALAQFL